MRKMLVVIPVVIFFLLLTPHARAFAAADVVLDDAALAHLEDKAQHADPRERCFLYTELAHFYTIAAGKEIASGDMDRASASLKKIEHYGELIHGGLSSDVKKLKNLKNAEMLMHETTYHLGEYLHLVSSDDKAEIVAALRQLDKVNEEMLAQVFAH